MTNLTFFCAKVRIAVNDYFRALSNTPRLHPIYNALQDIHNLYKAHIAECVLYSTLPKETCGKCPSQLPPAPDDECLVPSSLAHACERVPQVFGPTSAVMVHAKRVSFLQEPIQREHADSPTCSTDRRPTYSPGLYCTHCTLPHSLTCTHQV